MPQAIVVQVEEEQLRGVQQPNPGVDRVRFWVTTHAAWAGRAPAARAADSARASRMAVRALRPLRRPVSTIEQRAA
jgi:hypothetical protein